VNIKGFGAFAFEIQTELPKIATKSISPYENISEQRTLRKHVHNVIPRFVVDDKLKKILFHYPGKDQLDAPLSQYTIYQKGFRMIYCNPYPIASGC
jgi:hypothetical protein